MIARLPLRSRKRRSPESWLAMQDNYDLCLARKSANLSQVRNIPFEAIAQACTGSSFAGWQIAKICGYFSRILFATVGTAQITPPDLKLLSCLHEDQLSL